MFNSLEEIRGNQYIGRLESLANTYGIKGAYMQHNSEKNPENNGIYFICGYDINTMIVEKPNSSKLINSSEQTLLNRYGSHVFRLDGCNPEKTYNSIKNFCQDAQLLKPVYNDKYINNLERAVNNFGLYGNYFCYDKNEKSDYSGLYFVCGTNKEQICDQDLNIKDIMEYQRKNSDYFHYSIKAFPLDSFYSFATHQAVMNFCRDSDFIRNIYRQYNREIPEKVTAKALVTMKMLNSNLKNPQLSEAERNAYNKAMIDCFDVEDTYHNPISSKFEKNQFLMSGQYDTSKGKFENWIRQNFGQDNNCVSLEHLFTECNGAIGHLSVNIGIADKIKEEFRKRPDILYWISKPMGEVIDFPDGQGYGLLPEDNDIRTVDIAYNAVFEQDVDNIVNRICYPEAYKTTPEQMRKEGFDPYLISISQDEYQNFVNLCQANNVPFCIDEEIRTHACGQINIIVPKEKLKMVDLILSRLCIESERFQISLERPASPKKELKQFDLDELKNERAAALENNIAKKLSEHFPNSNFQMVGGSFDDFDR